MLIEHILAIGVEGKIYPSFAIEKQEYKQANPGYMIKTTEIGINEFAVPLDPIITNRDGTAYTRSAIMCLKNTNIFSYSVYRLRR